MNKDQIGHFQMIHVNTNKLIEIKQYYHDEKDKLSKESLVNSICTCYDTIFHLNETIAFERDNFRMKTEKLAKEKIKLLWYNIYIMVALSVTFALYLIK